MVEIWKDVKGYEGMYQVSNLGRVKSLPRQVFYRDGRHRRFSPEKIRRLTIGNHGYYVCSLVNDNKRSVHTVHTLVASAFLDNPDSLRVVDHMDGDKLNCRVENLEYVSHRENNRRAYSIGLRSRKDGRIPWWERLSEAQINMIKECWQFSAGFSKQSRPFTRAWLARAFKLGKYEVKAIVDGS